MGNNMDFKIPKEAFNFIHNNGTKIDGKYMFMPFWFEIVDKENGIVKMHQLGELPTELIGILNEDRYGK